MLKPVMLSTENYNEQIHLIEANNNIPKTTNYSLQHIKESFLKSLKSPSGKNKYKRYSCSPLRYAGGKSLAVGLIVELIPDNVKTLRGGSIEIACANMLGINVIGYDIFDLLANYWQVQIQHPNELYQYLAKFEPTNIEFKKIKDRLKEHWKKENIISNPIELAAYYYFNHNTSYGPHFLGSPSSVYLQETRYNKVLEKVKNFKL